MEIESTEEATCWFAVLPKNVKLVQNIYFKMPGIAAAARPLCGAVCGDMFDTDCHLRGHPTGGPHIQFYQQWRLESMCQKHI